MSSSAIHRARVSAVVAALLAVVAAVVLVAIGPAPTAAAITGGEADGEGHPSVALIRAYDDSDGTAYRCSASLVSPTVLLTAGHCVTGVRGAVLVTFESVVAAQEPAPLPDAGEPALGYQPPELQLAGYLSGTAHPHPSYADFADVKNPYDVGVVVLDEPVTGVAPSEIAALGTLDQLRPLNAFLFTVVGYGTEVVKPDSGPRQPTAMGYPLVRRVAESPGQRLTEQVLLLNGNPHDTRGTGGICFGDSGGPAFLNESVVAVTSYAFTNNCRYLAGFQRVDIEPVQTWLASFGVTPAIAAKPQQPTRGTVTG